jgi:hypothetical protein
MASLTGIVSNATLIIPIIDIANGAKAQLELWPSNHTGLTITPDTVWALLSQTIAQHRETLMKEPQISFSKGKGSDCLSCTKAASRIFLYSFDTFGKWITIHSKIHVESQEKLRRSWIFRILVPQIINDLNKPSWINTHPQSYVSPNA